MDYSGAIPIIGALIGGTTTPDKPNVPAYEPVLTEERSLEEYVPQLAGLVDQQADIASSLLKGELPPEVQDQIRMFAGENAIRGGFGASATRTGNLTMRDLGLSSLDAMAMGQQYTGFLHNWASEERMLSYNIQTNNANMLYDAWASNAEGVMRSYDYDLARHNQIWSGITQGATDLATSWGNSRNQQAANDLYDSRTQSSRDFQMQQTQMIINALG